MKEHLCRGGTWLCAGLVIGVVGALTFLNEPVVGRGTAMNAQRIQLATGQIAANHEALYVFDTESGELYAYELRWKGDQIDFRGARRNCLKDLDISQRDLSKTRFAMVTGQFDKNTDAVLIAESNRGKVAAYKFEDHKDGVEFVGLSKLDRGDRGGRRRRR